MNEFEWIFNGVGTEILSFLFALVLFLLGINRVNRKVTQIQKASEDSKQQQVGEINYRIANSSSKLEIGQKQKSGNSSSQTQIGRINNDD